MPSWNDSYVAIMQDLGETPYQCASCDHVARSTLGEILHWRFNCEGRK